MVLADEKKCPKSYGIAGGCDEKKSLHGSPWLFWRARRYMVGVMAFFGFFNIYALRVNLSIAIVDMTEAKNYTFENGTTVERKEFDWDNKVQGYILSSFFYGYITTQLLGGFIASKIGGKTIFGCGIAVTAALTFITPWLVNVHVYLLVAVRVIEGIFEGVTYPCIHAIWAKWAPPLERSRLATIAFSGSYVGTVVSMPLGAYLAKAFGWESIFYVFGAAGLVWFVFWMILVAESPELDPKITEEEKKHILESLNRTEGPTKIKVPWGSIVTSAPAWAIVMAHFSENWGFYTLLTQLPKYLKDMLQYDLGHSGFLSALPYLAMSIMIQFSGHWADVLQEKGLLNTTQVRKLFNCGAFIAQMAFMMLAAFLNNRGGTISCITIAVGLGAFAWAGFSVNHLDIAPQYASVLMGMSNTFATLPGMISPILTGYIVPSEGATATQWQAVFYISAGVYLAGAIIYGIFASGELQSWAIESESLQGQEMDSKKKASYHNESAQIDDNV